MTTISRSSHFVSFYDLDLEQSFRPYLLGARRFGHAHGAQLNLAFPCHEISA
jgi:hypothetical protein